MAIKKTYADSSSELDEILAQLQDPMIDVDKAVKLYERGQKVIGEMQTYLKQAENTVRKLTPKSGA